MSDGRELRLGHGPRGRISSTSMTRDEAPQSSQAGTQSAVGALRASFPAAGILVFGMAIHALSVAGYLHALDATFFIYMLAMLVGAWAGYLPGLAITLLVIVVFPFLFRPGFTVSQINVVAWASLTLMSLFVSRTAVAQRLAEASLRALNDDLEAMVRQKTRDLESLLERERAAKAELESAKADADRANRLKDEFFATVSHELRGPLQGMAGYMPLLLSGALDAEKTQVALRGMNRSVKSLTGLIDEILDSAKILTGKMELDVKPCDLKALLTAAADNIRPAALAKAIALNVQIDSEIGLVRVDAQRLGQALWNLLSNAVKFTPRDGRVSMVAVRNDSGVCIEIVDTGVGMAAEFIPHAFDRYRQGGDPVDRASAGLGLGLSIVRHIVEAHGGTVRASSDGPGHGSAFRLDLPRAEEPAPAEHVVDPSA